MRKNRIGLLVFALALLGGLVALWGKSRGPVEPEIRREVERGAGGGILRDGKLTGDLAVEDPGRREELPLVADERPTEETGTEPVLAIRPLHGLIVNWHDQPLAGVPVELCLSGSPEGAGLDFEARLTLTVVERTESDEGGAFRFGLPVGVPHIVRVPANETAGWAEAELAPCFGGDRITVHVQLAGSLRGVVVEAGTGTPVEAALVRAWGEAMHQYGPVESRIDGSFRLGGLPPGSYVCQVYPREHRRPSSVNLVVEAGESHEVRIEVDRGLTLRGRITDAQTGLPIEGAAVREGYVTPRDSVLSDAAGEYVLPGVDSSHGADIYVVAEGYGQSEGRSPATEAEEARLDFTLTPGRRVVGRVLNESDRPLSGVKVTAAASSYDGPFQQVDWSTARTDDQGRFELTDVRRDQRHVLRLARRGYGTRIYDFPDDEQSKERFDFGDLHLFPSGLIAGRVLLADGSSVSDAYLVLTGSNGDRHRFGRLPDPWSVDHYVATIERSTDELGSFQFGSLAAGEWSLRATSEGISGEATATVVLIEGETADSLELCFSGGAVIAGRVLGPDGRAVGHAIVSVRISKAWYARVETEEDGGFHLDGLPEGEYELRVSAPQYDERLAGRHRRLSNLWVDDVETGREDVEIRLPVAVKIRGRAIGPDGEPVAHAWIRVLDARGRRLERVLADDHGKFEIDAPEGLPIVITAHPTVRDERHVEGRSDDPGAREGRVELPEVGGAVIIIRVP